MAEADEVADTSEEEEVVTTIWAPEDTETVELSDTPVDEWVHSIDFDSTENVPVPERLVDQVIGQKPGHLLSVRQQSNVAI